MNKVDEILDKINYYELNDAETFRNFLVNLDANKLFDLAIYLNQSLRNKENENVISDSMIAGELVAPTNEIRNAIVEKFLNTSKMIDDRNLLAELIYYTFINLHMFSDGNGRISRLLYGIFSGEIEDDVWYLHDDDKSHQYEGDFCTFKGMKSESDINEETNDMLADIVDFYIPNFPQLENKYMFRTFYNGAHGSALPIKKIIPDNVLQQLTDDELLKIGIILDDNEGYYSIAGLTMLIVSYENGQLAEWIRRDYENSKDVSKDLEWIKHRLSFNLKKSMDLLQLWSLDDWKKVISVGNKLKLRQFDNLNNIYLAKYNKEYNKNINL